MTLPFLSALIPAPIALRGVALALAAIICGTGGVVSAETPLAEGDRILFLGDSITQDGRYVDLVRGYLWAVYPDKNLTIVNAGLSSETVSGITEPVHPYPRPNVQDRIDRALRFSQPDWVLVCYGMNDGIYHPVEERITRAYREGLQRVIEKIDAAGAKTVLISPPVFDAAAPAVVERLQTADQDAPYGYQNPFPNYDQTLAELGKVGRQMAEDTRVERFIDVHAATVDFLAAAKEADPGFVYGDGVHPPVEGHRAMAAAVLVGMGEPAGRVDRVLAKLAGLRPPGVDAQALPAAENAAQLLEALTDYGRAINAAYRQATHPETSEEQAVRTIEQATEAAAQQRAAMEELARGSLSTSAQ